MRDDDFVRLSIDAARVEIRGGDSSRLLAERLHELLDAGVGIARWPLAAPHRLQLTVAGVLALNSDELQNLLAWAPHHPRLRRETLDFAPAFRLSDEIELSTFWASEVWWHLHGIRDGRYPGGISLGVHNGRAGLIGIHRNNRNFTTEEIALLNLLGEPLRSALQFRAALTRATNRISENVRSVTAETGGAGDGPLTIRELDVLALVSTGRTNDMVGRMLGITERTVRKHLTNTYAKLEVSSRTAAAMWYCNTAPEPNPSESLQHAARSVFSHPRNGSTCAQQ